VARNRQRAKERQARRKSGEPDSARPDETPVEPAAVPEDAADDSQVRDEEEIREQVDLEVGAPPETLGRSDEVLEDEPELDGDDAYESAADEAEDDVVAASAPTGRRGSSDAADHKDRPRFVQFLFAVRAELARVQWPDRQTLTTLTGVVLGFVVIAGSYLGLLDAIFSRVIQALL
jgi:preprotein translocase SecE subunit